MGNFLHKCLNNLFDYFDYFDYFEDMQDMYYDDSIDINPEPPDQLGEHPEDGGRLLQDQGRRHYSNLLHRRLMNRGGKPPSPTGHTQTINKFSTRLRNDRGLPAL